MKNLVKLLCVHFQAQCWFLSAARLVWPDGWDDRQTASCVQKISPVNFVGKSSVRYGRAVFF